MAEIEPTRLYSSREAAALITSPHGGTIWPGTLLRWVKEGLLKPEYRVVGKRRWVFFWGAELLRFLNPSKPPEWRGKTDKQRQAEIERARKGLAKNGIIV